MRSLCHRPAKAGAVARVLARALPIVALVSGAGPTSAAQASALLPPGVTVVRDDPTGVTLEYTPPSPDFEATADPSGGVRVDVAGHSPHGAPGEPDLPSGIVRIGVPATGEARLTIESVTYASVGDMQIAPVPEEASRDTVTALDYKPNASIYGGQMSFPSAPAQITGSYAMEPFRVVPILLEPVRWNPRTRSLEVVTRLRFRVDFPAAPAPNRAQTVRLRERSEDFYRQVLANFETARDFIVPRPQQKMDLAALGRGGTDSFSSSPNWVRIAIRTKGVYGITYNALAAAFSSAGLPAPQTAIGSTATLRLYNGGGLDLPELPLAPRPSWMKQIPILVQDGGNDRLDPGDEIIFYGLGLNGFLNEFDPDSSSTVHFGSRFADDNVYWLTWGGTFAEPAARMVPGLDGQIVGGPGTIPATKFTYRLHEESDLFENFSRYGEDGLFMADFTGGDTVTVRSFRTSSPGAVTTDSSTVKIRLYGHYEADLNGGLYSGTASWNSVALTDSFVWNDQYPVVPVKSPFDFEHTGLHASGGNDTLRITIYNRAPFHREVYLAWYELEYQRRYDALGQKNFLFASPADTGVVRYDVAGYSGSATPLVIDVTDIFGERLVTGVQLAAGTVSFEMHETSRRRYALWDDTALLAPGSIQVFPIQNLRDPSIQSDYVILAADVLQSAAGALLAHRSRLVDGAPEFRARLIPLSQIAAQFGWGILQPAAVRDFIKYAVENWDQGQGPGVGIVPEFVVLLGDATKDYRNLRQSPNRNVFPTYYRIPPSGIDLNTFATDDWFADLDADSIPDVSVGRFVAQSASELSTMIGKVVQYEADPELGEWRGRFIFVADDEMKGCSDRTLFPPSPCWDAGFYDAHTMDVEASAAQVSDAFDKVKIYMVEYPFGNSSEKPAAKRAYLNELKTGGLISHYAGHGGFDKMADENVFFSSDADATKIQNGRRLYIFTAYSCSIGTFDLSAQSSIAELLLRTPGGGSVASFASSAPAFSGHSRALAVEFTTHLMVPPGMGTAPRVGQAVRIAKSGTGVARDRTNDEKYMLLGDPALNLAIPKKQVRVDPHPGFFSAQLDSVTGAVMDGDSVDASFNGTASVLVSGTADTSGYTFFQPPGGPGFLRRARYSLLGGTLYRGEVAVVNGLWKALFFVTSDLRQGGLGRVRAYVSDGSVDGLGWADSISTTRQAVTDSSDVTGPSITLTFDGLPYRPNMTILQSALMGIRISDPHGVNLQADDDYFAISVTVDEGLPTERSANLAGTFRYDFGRYDTGELEATFAQIFTNPVGLGAHTFLVRASDNLSNRTEFPAEVVLVGAQTSLVVENPLNFPNPFSDKTCIQYSLSQNADVTLKIFTVNGRLIREYKNISSVIGINDCISNSVLEWDGRDQEGDDVANGVYFFKVSATPVDAPGAGSEAIGKAVVMRR